MQRVSQPERSWFRGPGGRRLGREFAWIIGLKLIAIGLIWWMSFTPAQRPDVEPAHVAERLLAPPAGEARDD